MKDMLIQNYPVPSGKLRYCLFGEGERTLAVLPGISLGDTFRPAAIRQQLRSLAEHFRVLWIDRRESAAEGCTLRTMSRDTAALLGHLGIRQADILGISQGGMIAQYLALERPETVRRLVLASAACTLEASAAAVLTEWEQLAENADNGALTEGYLRRVYSPAFTDRYGRFLKMLYAGLGPEDRERFRVMVRACFELHTQDRLAELSCPALVLGGERDGVLGPEAAVKLAAALPGAELQLYPEGSHGIFEEEEDFYGRVKAFLEAGN